MEKLERGELVTVVKNTVKFTGKVYDCFSDSGKIYFSLQNLRGIIFNDSQILKVGKK